MWIPAYRELFENVEADELARFGYAIKYNCTQTGRSFRCSHWRMPDKKTMAQIIQA